MTGFILATLILAAPAGDQVLVSWDFAQGLQGWTANESAQVRLVAGGIVVKTDGNDAILISPPISFLPRDGDLLEVKMNASCDGDIQWFYRTHTTGPYGGFEPQEQRLVPIAASEEVKTYRGAMLWDGDRPIIGLRFDLPEGKPGTYRVDSIRVMRPAHRSLPAYPWRSEQRLPIAPPRIDVAKQTPPETKPIGSDYTVAMWYFAAWEPEYTWDGWKQVAERSPWRIPLLYDSADSEMEFNGIRYYRASNPRVLDWHVHWLREHAVNLMLWDWYPQVDNAGEFAPTFFGNRALELGFLGKTKLGAAPVTTNRFANTMPFAVMWTNHAPSNRIAPGLGEYIVDQFFSQPNYYRLDDKPLLAIWSVRDLIQGAGGDDQAAK